LAKVSELSQAGVTRAAAAVLEELTPDEEWERTRLELRVERAFYEAGKALAELRDKRLYRSTHKTFEEYCRDRFGFSRRHPYRLMDAATVVDNLCPNGTQESLVANRTYVLPTSERQVRDLVSLEPEQQREIWQKAVEIAEGKVPSGKIVKGIVAQIKERPIAQELLPYSKGEVVKICRGRAEIRRHLGYWGIVKNVGYTECIVHITLKGEDVRCKGNEMRKIDRSKAKLLKEVSDRVANLARCNLDPAVWAILQTINQQEDITQVQLDLLTWAEERYGICHHCN
jgi:hypothetical protein